MAVAEWVTPPLISTSTLFLTLLMGIGLFFFVRASGKDRTETRIYEPKGSLDEVAAQVRAYLEQRSYVLVDRDDQGIATFQGRGQPSWFLMMFLVGVTAAGLACLVLVVVTLRPTWQPLAWCILIAAPLAGIYYRQRSQRIEIVRLRLEQTDPNATTAEEPLKSQVQLTIQGHRDELRTLEKGLELQSLER